MTFPPGASATVEPAMTSGETAGRERVSGTRRIGALGTAARVLVAAVFLAPGLAGRFDPEDVVVGLLVFPAVLLVWQRWRSRRTPARLDATGPRGFALNAAVFAALYLTPLYAPLLTPTSDGVLIFYGASMLLAAVRGYAGCEVLAISNVLLRRDDQVGCLLFSPIDASERRLRRRMAGRRRAA